MATVTASGARRFKLSKFILSWYGILIVYVLMTGIFLLLRMGYGNNPIALTLGSLTFRWYGIIITCGVIVASFLAQFLAERRGDDPDHVWRILPVLLVFGIVAARFWYVFNTWEGYKDYFFSVGNPTHAGAIEIWRGGIAIQGAVVGGIVGALLYSFIYNQMQKRKESARRFSLWRFSDFVAPGLVLAQGIGRWGNFMNNEAYGRQTQLPWGIKIPCEYRTSGTTPGTDNTLCPNTYTPNGTMQSDGIDKDALFHPTFFYESLWNYFTFLVLFFCIMRPKTIERRFKVKLRDGDIFLLYWVVYSIGRFFTEGFRTDSLYFMGNTGSLRTAQVIAIASILIAGFLLFFRHRKPFPSTEALSMRLAPVTAGGPSVVLAGAGASTAVATGTTIKGGKTVAPKKATATEVDEVAATPVDSDDEFDEPVTATAAEDAESAVEVEDEASEWTDEETGDEATAAEGEWAGSFPTSETPGSEASPAEVEAAEDEVDTGATRVEPLVAGPDAETAQVETSAVEQAVPADAPAESLDAALSSAPEQVAPELAPETVQVETNPVTGEIENVSEPESSLSVSTGATSVGEVPPPAVDTEPKAVDGDLAPAPAPTVTPKPKSTTPRTRRKK